MPAQAFNFIRPEDRPRIEELVSGERAKWAPPDGHPIAGLDGLPLGDYRLVALLGQKNNVGSRYFQLFVADGSGRLADEPLALGLHNSGPYPAFNWVELVQYRESLGFGERSVDLGEAGLDAPLFQALRQFAPPGGHLMVEYDSPSHRLTERILTLRYPPATSPIGYRMFGVGVRSYRDWYISEGGREGPRKLQGFVPLNEEIAQEKTAKLRLEVETMLSAPENPEHREWGGVARALGRKVLERLV